MQYSIHVSFTKKSTEFVVESGLDDGHPQLPFLHGYACHVIIYVSRTIRSISTFVDCVRSSQITKPLGVGDFGVFKRQFPHLLTTLLQKNRLQMPVKSDMPCSIRDAWKSVIPSAII